MQENFAQKYVELGNASAAYREAYNPDNSTDKTIWENACRTLAISKVSTRVFKLQQQAADRNEITVDTLITELEEARALALDIAQPSSMVSASMGKGKLLGLDKSELKITGQLTLTEALAAVDEPNPNEIGEE